MSGKFVDKIDPYHKAALKKQKKSDGSSRYRNKDVVELQTLPLIKGCFVFYVHVKSSLKHAGAEAGTGVRGGYRRDARLEMAGKAIIHCLVYRT